MGSVAVLCPLKGGNRRNAKCTSASLWAQLQPDHSVNHVPRSLVSTTAQGHCAQWTILLILFPSCFPMGIRAFPTQPEHLILAHSHQGKTQDLDLANCETPSALAWVSPTAERYMQEFIWEEGPGSRVREGGSSVQRRVFKLATQADAWRKILLGYLKCISEPRA